MILALVVERTDSWQNPPIWGDERLARGLQKYLARLPALTRVDLVSRHELLAADIDVALLFNPDLPHRAPCTLFWYQNDHDYDLRVLADTYDGLILASGYHRDEATRTLAGYPWTYEPVVCIDPELFPRRARTAHYPVVYLGNNIKGVERTERYVRPAIPFGLHLFGSYWDQPPYAACWHGPLKGLSSNTQVYTDADVVLSFHLQKHADWNMPVCRITEALACERIVISDKVGVDLFGGYVFWTDGEASLTALLDFWLIAGKEADRVKRVHGARQWVFEHCSMADQAARLAEFCAQVMQAGNGMTWPDRE